MTRRKPKIPVRHTYLPYHSKIYFVLKIINYEVNFNTVHSIEYSGNNDVLFFYVSLNALLHCWGQFSTRITISGQFFHISDLFLLDGNILIVLERYAAV